jgi:NAD(P)-dependent dehydrogenase (short-subunit alcohol dehydrogenase family)
MREVGRVRSHPDLNREKLMPYENTSNDYGLIGKVAIVSGAGGPVGQGLDEGVTNGRAAAILLARVGAKVCVVGRTQELAQHTVDIIKKEGGEAFAHVADVTKEAECRRAVEVTVDRYGRLDCLDNNVGRSAPGDVTQMSVDEWRSMFALNVDSMMMMCKYAIPAMVASGGGGAIVNIGSLRSIRPQKSTVYTVTKGAVIALTATLAVDHGAQGIRANCVVLGPVFTPNINRNLTPERRQLRTAASLMKREGTGWDTGYLVRFLLSDQSKFMTGQSICLDGGASLVGPSR